MSEELIGTEKGRDIELPEKPQGWTKKMQYHMSVEGGGIAAYAVFNPSGKECAFGWGYNTAKNIQGFLFENKTLTWAQLREAWKARA